MWPFKKKIPLTDDELRAMQMENYNSYVYNSADDFVFTDTIMYPYGMSRRGKELIPYSGITMVRWSKRNIPDLEEFKLYNCSNSFLMEIEYDFMCKPAKVELWVGGDVPRIFTFATDYEAENIFWRINSEITDWSSGVKNGK